MDKRLSPQDQKRLLNALARAKEMTRQMEAKEEEKRWADIQVPLTLAESLAAFTKHDLSTIRVNLKIKGASALKKQDLIAAIEHYIPDALPSLINRLDETRYKIMKQIAERGGHAYFPLEADQLAYFKDRVMLFSGKYKGKKVLVMPQVVLESFQQLDHASYRETVRRNTEWTKLTQGMLFYYGTLTLTELENLIQQHTGKIPPLAEYLSVMEDAASYYREIRMRTMGFSNSRVFDDNRVKQEHNDRPTLPFYPFTKAQLLLAGEPDFVDRNTSYRAFVDFIRNNYTVSAEKADSLIEECVYAIRIGDSPGNLLEFFQQQMEIDDLETIKAFMDHIVQLNNNTKQWFLKGYSPNEISAARKGSAPGGATRVEAAPALAARNVAAPVASLPVGKAEVIDLATRKKVGRNDPCPCGSGLKFKKCCGG